MIRFGLSIERRTTVLVEDWGIYGVDSVHVGGGGRSFKKLCCLLGCLAAERWKAVHFVG